MNRDYKICSKNSLVCGYPGRNYDWSLFCWDGSESYSYYCHYKGCNHHHTTKAPKPWADGLLDKNQYIHVPYNFREQCTIYRVYPNDSMLTGQVYRGHLIKKVEAVETDNIWYWRLIS